MNTEKCDELLQSGQLKKAIDCYEVSIRVYPEDAVTWYNKGFTHASLEQYEQAIVCLAEAIRLHTENGLFWHCKGVAHCELKQYQQAIDCFAEAVRLDPDHFSAWHGKGVTHGELKQYQQAIDCYVKAIRLDPDDFSTWHNKGVAHGKLKQYQQTLVCCAEAIRIDPEYASSWYNKGVAHDNLESYKQAIVCYAEAIRIDPEDALAWKNKGELHKIFHQYHEANVHWFRSYYLAEKTNNFPLVVEIINQLFEIYEYPLLLKRIFSKYPIIREFKEIPSQETEKLHSEVTYFLAFIDTLIEDNNLSLKEANKLKVKVFYHLNDNVSALELTNWLDDEHDNDLEGQYYFLLSLQGLAFYDEYEANLKYLTDGRISELLHKNKHYKQFFYGGLIFWLSGKLEPALQCFQQVEARSFKEPRNEKMSATYSLAALYMQFLINNKLSNAGTDQLINELLNKEEAALTGETRGFLLPQSVGAILIDENNFDDPITLHALEQEVYEALQLFRQNVGSETEIEHIKNEYPNIYEAISRDSIIENIPFMGGIELSYQVKQKANEFFQDKKKNKRAQEKKKLQQSMEFKENRELPLIQKRIYAHKKDEYEKEIASAITMKLDYLNHGPDYLKLVDIMCLKSALKPYAYCMLRSYVLIMMMYEENEKRKADIREKVKYTSFLIRLLNLPFDFITKMAEILEKVDMDATGKMLFDFSPDVLDAYFKENHGKLSYDDFKKDYYEFFSREKQRLGDRFITRYFKENMPGCIPSELE